MDWILDDLATETQPCTVCGEVTGVELPIDFLYLLVSIAERFVTTVFSGISTEKIREAPMSK